MAQLESAVITNVGKVRGNNEDNYYLNGKFKKNVNILNEDYSCICDDDIQIFSVCDGMGGEECGELASLIAVKSIKKFVSCDFEAHIPDYIDYANNLICDEIKKNNGVRIGSTIALAYINGDVLRCYNVGDSRIYLYRDASLIQLSKDHTKAQRLVDMGVIDAKDMNIHKDKHILTQHLGVLPDEMLIQPYESEKITLKSEDIILLCSDGLTDMLEDKKIAEIISRGHSARDTASALVYEALTEGGRDNTTVAVIRVCDGDAPLKKSFFCRIFKKW